MDIVTVIFSCYQTAANKFESLPIESGSPGPVGAAFHCLDDVFRRLLEGDTFSSACSHEAWVRDRTPSDQSPSSSDFFNWQEQQLKRLRSRLVSSCRFDLASSFITKCQEICCFHPGMLTTFRLGAELLTLDIAESAIHTLQPSAECIKSLESYLLSLQVTTSDFCLLADDAVRPSRAADKSKFIMFWRGFMFWRNPVRFRAWQHLVEL